MRDLVIGATVVTGDGVVAKSGGRVIKNVAGFDLARLYCGATGTLGLVTELAFRVHALRPHSRTIRVSCPATAFTSFSRSLRAAGVEPTAADWMGPTEAVVLVRVEQRTERAVTSQAEAALCAAFTEGLQADMLDAAEERDAWANAESILAGSPGDTVVRIGSRPSRLPEVIEALMVACAAGETDFAFCSHAVLGVHTARLRGGRAATAIMALRTRMGELRGHVTTRRRGPDLGSGVDRWGAPPSGLDIMRRVKQELDPYDRCAPGTFVGGI
jgi:glycolate oxidase FAD binding subunit